MGREEIKKAPSLIEKYLKGKHFLHAVRTLSTALRLATSDGFQSFTGLAAVRRDLERKKAALPELLLEELHTHVYVKGMVAEARGAHILSVDFGGKTRLPADSISRRTSLSEIGQAYARSQHGMRSSKAYLKRLPRARLTSFR